MPRPEDALLYVKRLALQRLCLGVAALRVEDQSQRGHRFQCFWAFWPQSMPSNFYGFLLQCLRPRIETQVIVNIAHDGHHLRLPFRVFRETGVDVRGSFVQNLAGGDRIASSFTRARHFEYSRHEVGDTSSAVTLPGRPVAFLRDVA